MEKYDAIIRQYRMIYDHHTHTIYSHGKGTILDNVRAAAAKGIRSIAITDHGPGHLTYGIKMEQLPQMRKDIAAERAQLPHRPVRLRHHRAGLPHPRLHARIRCV